MLTKPITILGTLVAIVLLAACSQLATTPATGDGETPEGVPPAAVLQAQEQLADRLGLSTAAVEIVSVERMEWQDSCLGLGGPAESCAQVITPGWQVTFRVDGQEYVMRTDETGSQIRLQEEGS